MKSKGTVRDTISYHIYMYLSACLSTCLFICLSVLLSVHLFVCLLTVIHTNCITIQLFNSAFYLAHPSSLQTDTLRDPVIRFGVWGAT